jgi:hypothetical protein
MDRASWEFADLRSRVAHLEGRTELEPHDMLRAHVLARIVFDAWRNRPGMSLDQLARDCSRCCTTSSRWWSRRPTTRPTAGWSSQGVLPEVDLRPFIRRSRTNPQRADGLAPTGGHGNLGTGVAPAWHPSGGGDPAAGGAATLRSGGFGARAQRRRGRRDAHDDARRPLAAQPRSRRSRAGPLNRLVGRHLPDFGSPPRAQQRGRPALSPGLARAIDTAQLGIRQRIAPTTQRGEPQVTTPAMLEELHQRKQALKKAAATPEERATIEIVALLFQSILTEDRIPASVRVWFARLQMPVLRVAVTEPDFFATIDHPARRLIDRMGACVMGFDSAAGNVGDALEKEIKRIVQVVEAYPDTGRRVFQTVLTEFEKFLEHYFKTRTRPPSKGVSLAQQVEQRETLAIQYTIELRRMLNEVPVQEGVRQFLFHVWADVLATTRCATARRASRPRR